jgi:hypothetical protein
MTASTGSRPTARSARVGPQARALASSPLVRAGGAIAIDLLDRSGLTALRSEVAASWHQATSAERAEHNDGRRGDPDRSLGHIDAGPVLDQLYADVGLAAMLYELTGAEWQPLGAHAGYSIYNGQQYLGPHRDIEGCDVTAVVIVHDDTPGGHPLWFWPGRAGDPLDEIRRDPLRGRRALIGRPGQAVVLLGSVVPHQLPKLPPDRTRIVAPLCFGTHSRFLECGPCHELLGR